MARILIIGAAGYVGQEIVKILIQENHHISVITNANGQILLDKYEIDIYDSESFQDIKDIDIIINLAYPKGVSPKVEMKRNNELFEMISHAIDADTKVIHVSTQAVFGYELEVPPHPGPVKSRLDHGYVTSKIYLENKLIDSLKNNELHILRLGNVWGPASPLWTVNLLNRVLLGDVVGVKGMDGYSNLTDVANVASYIRYLISYDTSKKLTFHHLAEFNDIKWSHWLELIGKKLQLDPFYLDYTPPPSKSIGKEVLSAISAASPMNIGKTLVRSHYSGSFIRGVLARSPGGLVDYLEKKNIKMNFFPNYYNVGLIDTFLKLMNCTNQFESVTVGSWVPEIDKEMSWSRVEQWIDQAGYLEVKL